MQCGDENFVNSFVIRSMWPSVTTSESRRFQNLCEMSSSSSVALRMCKFTQYDELSVDDGFGTHDMDFSMSVTLQHTNELATVGCGMHSLHDSLSRGIVHRLWSA